VADQALTLPSPRDDHAARVGQLPDLAARRLGGAVMWTNDDFFADVHQLIAPEPAVHDPSAYGTRGKVYDGWETRRRRSAGDDQVIVRLGAAGVVRAVVVDTAFFTGNYPQYASIDATTFLGHPTADEVRAAVWRPLVERAPLRGDTANLLPVADSPDRLTTHVRLTIHPDGGVARLRILGEVVPDPRRLGGRVDLGAVEHGGVIEDCSDMFYSSPANVLMPGAAHVMSDGWETARRRDDGNDWLVVRLGVPGVVEQIVVDTSRFVGNAPGWARLTDAATGAELLARTRLLPDTEHLFRALAGPAVSAVRLDVYPDGGLSRLRLRGTVPPERHDEIARRWRALLPPAQVSLLDPADLFA
jgi:allantoicase